MIRYAYVNNQVLNIYSMLPTIKFPLDTKEVIHYIPNCRYMSYQQFAKISQCSIDDVIRICESKSGCTHYDITNDRYLILCNQSTTDNNIGRQRWTCGHEIGHVTCNHHIISTYEKHSKNSLVLTTDSEYELEADYFAATLLAPFSLFKLLNIKFPIGIQNVFGLSTEASLYRYKQYLKWLNTRAIASWENDIISLYKQKKI